MQMLASMNQEMVLAAGRNAVFQEVPAQKT
jgi:hypothetical protein